MRSTLLTMASMVWVSCGSLACACSIHGSVAASANWRATGTAGGLVEGLLTLESTLVPPTSATTCAAGIGLGTSDVPLPAGVDVASLAIVIVHADGSHTPVAAFSFAPNSVTAAALATGAGSSGPPNTNPLFAGSTWFGFSSAVSPFTLPVLGPGEYTAFDFTVEVAEALLPLTVDAQFAGGEALTSGTPIFSGDHPAQYFAAANRAVTFVPEPASLLLVTVAAGCFTARRNRWRRLLGSRRITGQRQRLGRFRMPRRLRLS